MVEFRGAWNEAAVRRFLCEQTIPVRLAIQRPDGSPWTVTLWYRYREGSLECATGATADVARFLRREPTVAFDVSTNRMPYRGIRGNGTASVTADDGKVVLRDLVERYLGGTESSLAQWLLEDDREEVRIRIEPAEIYSWDYSERMADSDGQ